MTEKKTDVIVLTDQLRTLLTKGVWVNSQKHRQKKHIVTCYNS